MGKMRVTFVVPVYNVENYLDRCVKSLICKTDIPYEIILVNDGSTDSSPKLCEEWMARHRDIIRVVHKENGGLASARNKGIEEARGEYIVFVDSDDWLDGGFIEKIDAVIGRCHPDLIKYGYRRIEKMQERYTIAPFVEEGYYEHSGIEALALGGLGNGRLFDTNHVFVMSAWASVYKKEVIDRHALRYQSEREILNEDILFNLEYLLKIESAYVMHDIFYNYDCRDGSLTQKYKPLMYERKCRLFAYYEPILQASGLQGAKDCKKRYAQFVMEHLYDCMVMEMQWNKKAGEKYKNIRRILSDPKWGESGKHFKNKELSMKARLMLSVIALKNPVLLCLLYGVSHGLAEFGRRVMK